MAATARELRSASTGEPGAEPSSVRKAALLLHGLADIDREWVLSQLSKEERARLAPLLRELRSLGIPAERSLLDEALGQASEPAPAAAPPILKDPGPNADRARLERADPARLADLLRGEPVQLVACLLAMGDWPWREALLKRLDRPARRQVEEALADGAAGGGAALREHLLAAVARRLGGADPDPAAAGASSWVTRLGQRRIPR